MSDDVLRLLSPIILSLVVTLMAMQPVLADEWERNGWIIVESYGRQYVPKNLNLMFFVLPGYEIGLPENMGLDVRKSLADNMEKPERIEKIEGDLYKYIYKGMTIEVGILDKKRTALGKIVLTNPKKKLTSGLQVGQHIDKFIQILGKPAVTLDQSDDKYSIIFNNYRDSFGKYYRFSSKTVTTIKEDSEEYKENLVDIGEFHGKGSVLLDIEGPDSLIYVNDKGYVKKIVWGPLSSLPSSH